MAKLNEQLKAELEFKIKEVDSDPDFIDRASKQVIVSAEYEGIYRQFSFHIGINAHPEADVENLIEEGKNIITHTIGKELSKKYIRCKSCGSHIMQHFDKSTMHKCESCGTINEIKVLVEKK